MDKRELCKITIIYKTVVQDDGEEIRELKPRGGDFYIKFSDKVEGR